MMKTLRATIFVLLICALIPGCAGMSDEGRTKAEGTALGAVAGGLLGLVIGGEEGAAIGAVAGAGLGFLAGNEVAKRKKAYANTEDFLDAEIAGTQEFNKTAIAYNTKMSKEIASLEQESTSLRAKYDTGKINKKALAAKKKDLEKQIADNARLEKTLAEELNVQNTILTQERKDRPADDKYIARLEKEVNTLQKNLETLRVGSTQLAGIDQRLSV
jgi:hypothetical protein